MQENSVLYEVTRHIQNKENIQNDFKEAINLTTNLFKEKYFNKINLEIKSHKDKVEKSPSKEITLLRALKSFYPKENQGNIDNMINMIISLNTFSSIKNEFEKSGKKVGINNSTPETQQSSNLNDENSADISAASLDSSIKHDGIYDYDVNCISNNNLISNEKSSSSNLLLLSILFYSMM